MAHSVGKAGLVILLLFVAWSTFAADGWAQEVPGSGDPDSDAEEEFDLDEYIKQVEKIQLGFIQRDHYGQWVLSLPMNGSDYPNILLTLSMGNSDGDADIACVPGLLTASLSLRETVWKSSHSHGRDFVFISREHDQYKVAKKTVQIGGKMVPGVSFICMIFGRAPITEYMVEIDVDYTSRPLAEEEQSAMSSIYKKCCTGGPGLCPKWSGNKDDEGNVSMDFCHSPGSICDEDGQLVRLSLMDENLDCSFPTEEISELSRLEKLEMHNNNMEGDISSVLVSFSKHLESLEFLSLGNNSLSGDLHEDSLCKMTNKGNLIFLSLERNLIRGSIPKCIFGSKSALKDLRLGENQLTGSLPEISPDSPIQRISIFTSGLSGMLHPSLGLGKKLEWINLSGNELTGKIPGSILTSKYIFLNDNKLDGFSKEWYAENSNLSALNMANFSNNALQGSFPLALLLAPRLLWLHMSNNKLSGPLPNQPGMMPLVISLDLANNFLEGQIPESLGGIMFFNNEVAAQYILGEKPKSVLRFHLNLSGNRFDGAIPKFLSEKAMLPDLLERVNLQGNNFEVSCPPPIEFQYIFPLDCADTSHSAELSSASAGRDKGHKRKQGSVAGTLILGALVLVLAALFISIMVWYKRRIKKKAILDILAGSQVEIPSYNHSSAQIGV